MRRAGGTPDVYSARRPGTDGYRRRLHRRRYHASTARNICPHLGGVARRLHRFARRAHRSLSGGDRATVAGDDRLRPGSARLCALAGPGMDGAKALAPMRLHLVDGTYELFRAHFSKRPDRRSRQGQDVKATAGIASSLIALLSDPSEAVTHLAVAFDNPIRSFRNDLFQDYKSDEGVAPELLAQFDLAEAAVRSLGIVVWSMDQWEADDAIATAAARWRGQVTQVRILSPDKDFGQCLDG